MYEKKEGFRSFLNLGHMPLFRGGGITFDQLFQPNRLILYNMKTKHFEKVLVEETFKIITFFFCPHPLAASLSEEARWTRHLHQDRGLSVFWGQALLNPVRRITKHPLRSTTLNKTRDLSPKRHQNLKSPCYPLKTAFLP